MMDKAKSVRWMVLTAVVVTMIASVGLLGTARPRSAMTITVSNSLQSSIRNLYLAPGNPDDWGANQLGEAGIAPGGSVTLSNV